MFFLDGLEEAIDVSLAIEEGRVEILETYVRENNWIHPIVGEVILHLLDGTHTAYRLEWGRSRKLTPTELSPTEALYRNDYLRQQVQERGGFKRGMYARICHEVGAQMRPPLEGRTVERLVRRFRPKSDKAQP